MIIDGVVFEATVADIITELRTQLAVNQIPLLRVTRETPDDVMVACPYHKGGQERKPSAGIRKSDGTFHCFACGETHNLQEVISHCFGKEDLIGAFGWSWLLKNFCTVDVENRKPIELDISRQSTAKPITKYVTEEELDTYRVYHPYMWKRKMTPEVVDIFDIGYDEKTKCITFPIRNENGDCLFIARRSTVTKFFNYPQGAEKPVYGLYELRQLPNYPDEVIICESMIDAISFWAAGKYAVALNGLGNELQFKQLNSMPCRKFILATDSDAAGMSARKKIRSHIRRKLITEYMFPKGRKDANDCTAEELKNLSEIF